MRLEPQGNRGIFLTKRLSLAMDLQPGGRLPRRYFHLFERCQTWENLSEGKIHLARMGAIAYVDFHRSFHLYNPLASNPLSIHMFV